MREKKGLTASVLRSVGGMTLLLVIVTGCAPVSGGTAAGSCAVKEIVLGSSDLRPGGEIQLSVDWMTARCEDTGGTNRPAEDIDVTITPIESSESRHLGTIKSAAGPRFTAAGTFPLPDDIPAGDGVLAVTSTTAEGAVAELPITLATE
ncbi:hypothetical protein ITJ55_00785 [Frigoribacterium sp. VKM Ac-1396]|uniref:hypothetical protein n=1 Tax=Frigoribacterium sp. VKM Ac-1396 TaxID=2783821 RepID=UPI00188B709D|nr:hypothetical protein [Frigoribacterium sp. VKM Ac-1396]MBF4599339.1 hypothetical protein [Frigoribacterium sp. VKM Ac-1396]